MNSIILWSCISRIVLDCILTFLVCLPKRKKRNNYFKEVPKMEQNSKVTKVTKKFDARKQSKIKPSKWYRSLSRAIDKLMAKMVKSKAGDAELIDLLDDNIIQACLTALSELGDCRGDTVIYTQILDLYVKEGENNDF